MMMMMIICCWFRSLDGMNESFHTVENPAACVEGGDSNECTDGGTWGNGDYNQDTCKMMNSFHSWWWSLVLLQMQLALLKKQEREEHLGVFSSLFLLDLWDSFTNEEESKQGPTVVSLGTRMKRSIQNQ